MKQYIGARYVVKIYENSLDPSSAEWESGVTYEPLTMVTWQNSTYLSKSEVPDNISNPPAAPEYWTQTGFYNGQIMTLNAQVTAINDLLGNITLPTTAQTITGSIKEIYDQLSPLDGYHVLSDLHDVEIEATQGETWLSLWNRLIAKLYNEVQNITDDIVLVQIYEPVRGNFSVAFRDYYTAADLNPANFVHAHATVCALTSSENNVMQGFIDMRETDAAHYYVTNYNIADQQWTVTNLTHTLTYDEGDYMHIFYQIAKKIEIA